MSGWEPASLRRAFGVFDRLNRAAKAEIEAALVKGAEEVAARARALAPVDEDGVRPETIRIDRRTYRRVILKDSIKVRAPRRGVLGRGRSRRTSLYAEVVVTDPKAGLVEFGGARTGASPFFFVAVRSLRKRVTGRVRRALRKAAKAAAGRV